MKRIFNGNNLSDPTVVEPFMKKRSSMVSINKTTTDTFRSQVFNHSNNTSNHEQNVKVNHGSESISSESSSSTTSSTSSSSSRSSWSKTGVYRHKIYDRYRPDDQIVSSNEHSVDKSSMMIADIIVQDSMNQSDINTSTYSRNNNYYNNNEYNNIHHNEYAAMLQQQQIQQERYDIVQHAIHKEQERRRIVAIAALYRKREQQRQLHIDRVRYALNRIQQQQHQCVTPLIVDNNTQFPTLPTEPRPSLPYEDLLTLQKNMNYLYNTPDGITSPRSMYPNMSNLVHNQPNMVSAMNNDSLNGENVTSLYSYPKMERPLIPTPPAMTIHEMMKARLTQPNVDNNDLMESIPKSLPIPLAQPAEDRTKLSNYQCLLRQQIEIFEAGEEDVTTHTRGRNKRITYGQVGIRCKHCAHVPILKRQKGSTYFPSDKLGIYQATQNMSTTHFQGGVCEYMPKSIKQQFSEIMSNRQCHNTIGSYNKVNGAGRPYWARSCTKLGLIDTERGIRFIRTLQAQQCGMIC